MTKDTDALPQISSEEVIARVNEAHENGNPLPTFARTTQEAMMADAFRKYLIYVLYRLGIAPTYLSVVFSSRGIRV